MANGVEPEKARGNPGWLKGMPSPNPSGRPPGIVDQRSRVTKALLDDAYAVVRVVVEAALEGDIQAAGIVLSRVAPALRPQADTVTFSFDAKASLVEQVESVLQAVADGQVAPDVGRSIIETIGSLAAMRQYESFEKRLAALESGRSR
jgi:hypothetical protein